MLKRTSRKVLACTFLLAACVSCDQSKPAGVERLNYMLTTPDKSKLLTLGVLEKSNRPNDSLVTIGVNGDSVFQQMDGFGYTLTGGSARHISQMDSMARKRLLTNLFHTDSLGIGVSYLRVSIGASDLDPKPFSYNDLPIGEEDFDLKNFSIDQDRTHLIPVLKQILEINPELKIMGSPWSAPAWMKDNEDTRGGSLKPECYESYAQYFIKYIEAMKAEGIPIDAITIQNEPLHPGNNPSMFMPAEQQADFVKNHLGPAFEKRGVATKIIAYDHNADRPDYPISIYEDSLASQYIDGAAFHLYNGDIDTLSSLHEAYPDKNLYFTEQWVGAPGDFANDFKWHTREVVIGGARNWCKTILEWNLSSNPELKPHTDRGGCDRCLGAVTIEGNEVVNNPAYYVIAHASKYVKAGAHRVHSNEVGGLPNVAFKNESNDLVLIVLNDGEEEHEFNIEIEKNRFGASLAAGAVATYVYKFN
ncbi:glycoside hydrolase family 30 protein [Fulvivirga sediminis]|uniref:Glucosylceramidase n=1 Tax=Fulvivirga sediminis TaxID=2803949 RepID=A0A937F909_9BACT|nr:glycoside hydrolase family 30 beta sandwich domain-containing protein [Fulvivirga sediminis]MBL3658697.1 glucosylceramidase [Fulvivirga sediminis]